MKGKSFLNAGGKQTLLFVTLLGGLMLSGCSSTYQTSGEIMKYDDNLKARLKGITVRNLNGEAVELESLWKNRRIVLTFFRHFG